MNPNILAFLAESDGPEYDEDLVFFVYESVSNHQAFECLMSIRDWLEENAIQYKVDAFQCNQAAMRVPDSEHRTMIKLFWPHTSRKEIYGSLAF